MRAPGEAPGLFALESAINELAYKFGTPIDPLELRLRNEAQRDQDGDFEESASLLRDACQAFWLGEAANEAAFPNTEWTGGWVQYRYGRIVPAGAWRLQLAPYSRQTALSW